MSRETRETTMNMTTMVVLSDGETFSGTTGCIVCEYADSQIDENEVDTGDADEIVELVRSGQVRGRILSIPALVELFDAVNALSTADERIATKLRKVMA